MAEKDETYVGRIREDESIENGINMWIVADNLRKGAALNAVQIAEKLIEMAKFGISLHTSQEKRRIRACNDDRS